MAEAEHATHLRAQHQYMQEQYRAPPLTAAGWSSCTQPLRLVEHPETGKETTRGRGRTSYTSGSTTHIHAETVPCPPHRSRVGVAVLNRTIWEKIQKQSITPPSPQTGNHQETSRGFGGARPPLKDRCTPALTPQQSLHHRLPKKESTKKQAAGLAARVLPQRVVHAGSNPPAMPPPPSLHRKSQPLHLRLLECSPQGARHIHV